VQKSLPDVAYPPCVLRPCTEVVKLCHVKTGIIINPKAGSVTDLDLLRQQIAPLNPAFVSLTRKPGQAELRVGQAIREGCDYIIAAGGDGTLNEVVNGIARHAADVRLGLLPLGTGNDFARCLKLPATIEENIEILRRARTRAIDLVRVKSDRTRYFVNVSAAGFSGKVNEKLTRAIKKSWGPLAYLRSAAAALPDLRAYRTSIRFGSKERMSIDLYNVIIANGCYVAGGLPIAPRANPGDGLLDVILIRQRPAAEMALLAARVLLGKHLTSDAVVFRRVPKVSIRSKPGMWFNVDGELVGNEPALFEVIPRALQFVVAKK
jgi:diacylglycerol kinase (ATP)